MVLGFNKRFVGRIMDGRKIHTIREDSHNRWRAGRKIHFATGVRTSAYDNFRMGECTGTQKIEIKYVDGYPWVGIDGLALTAIELESLAKNDGFDSIEDFLEWFDSDFSGKIIHWTRYAYA